MAPSPEPTTAADEALARHDWIEAYRALREADEVGQLDAEGLRRFAETAWWTGNGDMVLDAGERAYSSYLAQGDAEGAAMVAWWLALHHFDRLSLPLMAAWLAKAEQHAAEAPESAAPGYVAAMQGVMAMGSDLDAAFDLLDKAEQIGIRAGDPDLTTLAGHMKGRVLCSRGDSAGGMAMMDQAMASVVGGQVQPFTSGIVYCSMISACSDLGDYRRAAEWTEATTRWCERFSITGFPGICRIHRAEIIRLRGDLPTAENEARLACEELPRFSSFSSLGPGFYEIAEIRRRLGDFAGAEEAYAKAHEYGRDPQPGLSLVRLAQGKTEAAASGVARALAEVVDRPARVRLLWAQAEIALAAGDVDAAAAAADELDEIVATIPGTALEAIAACVRGAVRLAQGDPEGALGDLRRALRGWLDVDAPFEIGEVRLQLGKAYAAAGDREAAAMELHTARSTFERIGAVWSAERAGELLGELGDDGTAPERVHRALMFTDIVRSTELIAVIGDEAWEALLAWHDQTLRSLFASHGGEVAHHTGDGFFVAFGGGASAVRAAVAVQRALAEHRKSHGFAPTVRIGIHAAEATRRGADYSGAEVHAAARVADHAEGAEILVTAAVLAETDGGIVASEPREVELKGIDGTVSVASVEWRSSR